MTPPSYYPRDLSWFILVLLDQPPGATIMSGPFPRSTSISLAAIPKQSNPARSTSFSSQSAIAAADSSYALFLFLSSSPPAYAAGTIVVTAVVANNAPAIRKAIAKMLFI